VSTQYICDHSGAPIPAKDYKGPTRFVWEDTEYEFDLSTGSARAFAAAQAAHAKAVADMRTFAAKARPLPGAVGTSSASGVLTTLTDMPAVTKPKRVRKSTAKKAAPTLSAKLPDTGTDKAPATPHPNRRAADETLAIREWAEANGHPELIGKRGRIPAAITDEYEASKGAK
jgi:Lsr2